MKIIRQDPGFRWSDDAADPSSFDPIFVLQSPASDIRPLASTSPRSPLALGDWVELWAKPLGCRIDRLTARYPEWLVKPKPFYGIRLVRPTPKPRPWSRAWFAAGCTSFLKRAAAFLQRHTKGYPAWLTTPRYFPHTFRTGFCKGTCGCNKRRRFLNLLVPDVRRVSSWSGLFSRLKSSFRTVYHPPKSIVP